MHTLRNLLLIAGSIGLAVAGDAGNQETIPLISRGLHEPEGILDSCLGDWPAEREAPWYETAVFVAASENGNINGDFCKVTGIVKPHNPSSPNLEFEVNLPQAWNRRALQMGGGGYDGSLVTGLTQYSNEAPNERYASQARLRYAWQRRRA